MRDEHTNDRKEQPSARTSDGTEDRSAGRPDDIGLLLARAARAGGSAVWLVVRAVFVGLTAGVALLRDEEHRARARRWLLLEGDRWTIIAAVTTAIFLGVVLLGVTGVVGVRQSGFVTGLFGALISGMMSFVAIVLSVNQLAVSRLIGTPENARERITDVRDFRAQIAERAPEQAVLPTEPSAFMAVVAEILSDEVRAFREAADGTDNAELDRTVETFTGVLTGQTAALDERVHEGQEPLFAILLAMMDDSYSEYVNIARRIRTRYAASLSEAATERLGTLRELFTSLAVTRQYFKVLYLNQVFGRLSRQLVYTGLASLLAAILVVFGFSTGYAPLQNEFVILVSVGLALAVTLLPPVVFFAYILRIGTILKRSSAPGPFTPEGEKPEHAEYRAGRPERFFDRTDRREP